MPRLAIGSTVALAAALAIGAARPVTAEPAAAERLATQPGPPPAAAATPPPGSSVPSAAPSAALPATPSDLALPVPVAVPPAEPTRPTELALAIGVGYAFPTSIQTPNITSVRLRLPSGLTLEPQLELATTSNTIDTGSTIMSRQSTLQLGSLVRYPLRVRRRIDLELIGSATVSNQSIDPNGDNNNQTITSLAIGYGVGLAYWYSPHWNLSLTATNSLFAYTRTRQETGPDAATVDRSTTIGLVFEPRIALMLHLYD